MTYIDAINQQLRHLAVSFENGVLQIKSKKTANALTIHTEKIPRDALLFSDALIEYFPGGNFADLCSGNGIIGGICMLHGGSTVLSFDISQPQEQVLNPKMYQPIQILTDITHTNFPKEYPMLNQLLINPPQLPGSYKKSPADFGGENGDELLLRLIRKLAEDKFFDKSDNLLFISCFHPIRISVEIAVLPLELRVKTIRTYKAPFLPTSLIETLDPLTYQIEKSNETFPTFLLHCLVVSNSSAVFEWL